MFFEEERWLLNCPKDFYFKYKMFYQFFHFPVRGWFEGDSQAMNVAETECKGTSTENAYHQAPDFLGNLISLPYPK